MREIKLRFYDSRYVYGKKNPYVYGPESLETLLNLASQCSREFNKYVASNGKEGNMAMPFVKREDPYYLTFPEFMIGIQEGEIGVEQFTGLYDRNGKEIYEGDIIKCGNFVHSSVEYHNGCFYCRDENRRLLKTIAREGEVVGNIHENPELLEEEK